MRVERTGQVKRDGQLRAGGQVGNESNRASDGEGALFRGERVRRFLGRRHSGDASIVACFSGLVAGKASVPADGARNGRAVGDDQG